MNEHLKQVEGNVLEVFKEEIPSIYYSDKTQKEWQEWKSSMNYMYRDLMHFPPKMFDGCAIIDFGAGTGENTVYFDNWGAKCTLVEMNQDAQNVSKDVFKKYAKRLDDHKFICSSIFDYENPEKFDIVHSRGVLSHTADPERAFSKIVTFLRPGGYVIYGDGNKAGNFQNMLQRMVIFKFTDDWDEMVKVAEMLFKEDLDRGQKYCKRTRRCIIFDKFVVPKLKNPSVSEVLGWFNKNNITFYSSYPPVLFPVMSDSLHNRPRFKPQDFLDIGSFTEAFWMIYKDSDIEEVPDILESFCKLSEAQSSLTDYINDYNLDTVIDNNLLTEKIDEYQLALNKTDATSYLVEKSTIFLDEVKRIIDLLEKGDLQKVKKYLNQTIQLFRGAYGVRHVDFVGYKNDLEDRR